MHLVVRGPTIGLAQCQNLTDLFYGPDQIEEPETDQDKEQREVKAKSICAECVLRLPCLEKAMIWEAMPTIIGRYGVWGGMTDEERQRFATHMREEGYSTIPTLDHFVASLYEFSRVEIKKKLESTTESK